MDLCKKTRSFIDLLPMSRLRIQTTPFHRALLSVNKRDRGVGEAGPMTWGRGLVCRLKFSCVPTGLRADILVSYVPGFLCAPSPLTSALTTLLPLLSLVGLYFL